MISLGMHIKAYYRRAVCCEKRALANSARTVELLRKALDDVCVVLTVERENKQAVALKKRVEAMLETIENEISNKREPETESGPVCREGEWEMAVEQCKQKVKVLLEKSKYDEAIVELDSCLSLLDASRNTTNADAINDAHLSTSHMLIQVYKNQMVDASQEKACSSKIIDISTRCIAANNANIKSYLRRGQAYMVVVCAMCSSDCLCSKSRCMCIYGYL